MALLLEQLRRSRRAGAIIRGPAVTIKLSGHRFDHCQWHLLLVLCRVSILWRLWRCAIVATCGQCCAPQQRDRSGPFAAVTPRHAQVLQIHAVLCNLLVTLASHALRGERWRDVFE